MESRYVNTVITTFSVLSWINAVVLFILALALTFLSPFAVTRSRNVATVCRPLRSLAPRG